MQNSNTETSKESLVETLTYERADFAAVLPRRLAGRGIERERSAETGLVPDGPRKQEWIAYGQML